MTVTAISQGSHSGTWYYGFLYSDWNGRRCGNKNIISVSIPDTIKPVKATTYDVCVKVKDNQDNVVKKYFSLTVK